MNFRLIKQILGWILLFEAGFLLIPITTALVYRETESLLWFLLTLGICLAIGLLLVLTFRPKTTDLYSREGFVIVALSWVVLSLFGALPFTLSGFIPSYLDALFETVSGFTTTGATILTDVEALSKSMLMWRSFTHWIGGMGVLVFIMAFIPLSGGQNLHIMQAESPGPSVSKLVPRVRTTAIILYSLYLGLTVLMFLALLIGGMPVFDALTTTFGTAGTGGFGVHNESIAAYKPALQIIVTVFMLLFSINFNSYYLLYLRKFKESFTSEVKTFLVIVLVSVTAIVINTRSLFANLGEGIRHASFTVASIISTTGFTTTDFDLWPNFSKGILLLLMFIGACAGSTGGGIKVSRIMIAVKGAFRELRNAIHPHQTKKVTMDGRPVEDKVVASSAMYLLIYALLFILSAVLISFEGMDLTSTISSVASTINNVGPGLGLVGPSCNFAFLSGFSKAVLIFDMLAGRLELFPMILLFSPVTWKRS